MIEVPKFVSALREGGVGFFCGVPDSLLKSFCAYVTDTCGDRHTIAANEGGAVALAAGHYLATGEPALVYMQNSGQGNAVNPLVSLADSDVYSIPAVLLIGWRGMPGVHDEPQHAKQGKITLSLMETLGIPTEVLPDTTAKACALAKRMAKRSVRESRPVALVAKKGAFGEYALKTRLPDIAKTARESAIEAVLSALPENAVVVSTTGMISREVYETRERLAGRSGAEIHSHDFLTVGSMGHALMIALGIAKARPDRPVYCLDGDGASIMQMGNMAIVGQSGCANLMHIVFNNAAHDSVGGQPTVGGAINLKAIAKACGYATKAGEKAAPVFVEIKVAKGSRKDLGRPKEAPQVNKRLFMKELMGR
ncbi:MAG: phosphonopyruvate decarboxylase [Kiritimatiellae bacterium]|nr:phosphonopyruvate decarboxylase [Kiritimatiellia bacterium]